MKTNDQNGFSLLELMIAVSVSSVVVGGAIYYLNSFEKSKAALVKSSENNMNVSSIGANFEQVTERAGVSGAFMHLPIANSTQGASCDDSSPCVRSWDAANKRFSANSAGFPLTYTSIEFYRDSSGELTDMNYELPKDWEYGAVSMRTSESFIWSPTAGTQDYYATWPLVDENSKPFPMMVSSGSNDYFTLPSLQGSNVPTNPSFIKGTKTNQTDVLINHYFVIYSALNLKHFFIKKISTAIECTSSNCIEDPNIKAGQFFNKVKFEALTNGSLYNFFPTLNNVNSTNSWKNQNNFLYFPTQSFSLTGQSQAPDFNPGSNVTPHQIVHFYTAESRDLTIVPVEFIFFYLKKGAMVKNAQNILTQSYDLIQRKYKTVDNFTERTLAVSFVGKVYISRKIGTGILNLILQK